MNPLHWARTSSAGMADIPRSRWRNTPFPGAKWSGLDVAYTMASSVLRADPGHLQGSHGGAMRQIRSGLALGHPPPLLDAGAGTNPLVGGVHDLGQLLVRDHSVGDREPVPRIRLRSMRASRTRCEGREGYLGGRSFQPQATA